MLINKYLLHKTIHCITMVMSKVFHAFTSRSIHSNYTHFRPCVCCEVSQLWAMNSPVRKNTFSVRVFFRQVLMPLAFLLQGHTLILKGERIPSKIKWQGNVSNFSYFNASYTSLSNEFCHSGPWIIFQLEMNRRGWEVW